MTNFNTLGLLAAVAIPSLFVWYYIDGLILSRIETIATGMVRGVPVSLQHRRLMLSFSWAMVVLAGVIYCVLMFLLWLAIAINIADPRLRSFAYLCGFYAAGGFLYWSVGAFVWYFQLSSTLRQAETE